MKKPNKASITPAGWFIDCPGCGECVAEPDGGFHVWSLGHDKLDGKTEITHLCGARITLPKEPRWK